MFFNDNNNEEENEKNKRINNYNKNNLFKKVDIQIKYNLSPKSEKKLKEKREDIILPYIHKNRESLGKKMIHLQNFCNSIYSKKNNKTLGEINNIREKMEDALYDSKLKAIEEIKHYFFINKFPNEINFKKNKKKLEDIYKKIYTNRENNNNNINKPYSLKKINLISRNKEGKTYQSQDDEKFTYITTLKTKKEKKKIHNSIDAYSLRNKNYNFEDYATNQINTKHPVLYKLTLSRNKNENLPLIKKKKKVFNDIVEISKLIPDKTEINKEAKIINYDEYMRMKELKIIK